VISKRYTRQDVVNRAIEHNRDMDESVNMENTVGTMQSIIKF
jgi:hypothetical protein